MASPLGGEDRWFDSSRVDRRFPLWPLSALIEGNTRSVGRVAIASGCRPGVPQGTTEVQVLYAPSERSEPGAEDSGLYVCNRRLFLQVSSFPPLLLYRPKNRTASRGKATRAGSGAITHPMGDRGCPGSLILPVTMVQRSACGIVAPAMPVRVRLVTPAVVAQLARAADCDPEGWQFASACQRRPGRARFYTLVDAASKPER